MSERSTHVAGKRPTDCTHSEGSCKDCRIYLNCDLGQTPLAADGVHAHGVLAYEWLEAHKGNQ